VTVVVTYGVDKEVNEVFPVTSTHMRDLKEG
jgi:hypothetical protein